MTAYIRKDARGSWRAETNADISPTQRLKLSTYKIDSGAIVTVATVSTVNGIWEQHEVYKDFSKRLEVGFPKRVTSKAVELQHAKHNIDEVKAQALAFYA